MRLPALCAATAMAWLAVAPAQAACLTPDQVVEGRLDFVRITVEAYRLKEQAYILRLKSAACLEGDDDYDKIERTNRIHVFATDDALRKRLHSFVGKQVRVTGDAFGE